MDLLFANDHAGHYPDSWYAATATPTPRHPALEGTVQADVCIVGGGFTGASAALHLAQRGVRVVLLEAHRIGFGASGRNGGQLGSGQRQDQQVLEQMIGPDAARQMWDLGQDAKTLVRDLVVQHGIDCQLRDGVAWSATSPSHARDNEDYANHMARHYGYDIEVHDRESFAQICPSPAYCGGIVDMGAAHLHPLNLVLGLTQAAAQAGAVIYENSHVTQITEGPKVQVSTAQGQVQADHLILACNGYLGGLNRQVAGKVMPINNFVVATEPLGDAAAQVLTRDIAVADDLFVVNYFRLSHDNRLLFGGGESYGYRFPRDLRATVRKPMAKIFPHLRDVKLDYAWGGTLGITMKRMPYLARLGKNTLSASGYSGHGVGNAVQAGKLLAEAVQGQSNGFDAFARIPAPTFPGGPRLRSPLLALAMTWYAMRDRFGI